MQNPSASSRKQTRSRLFIALGIIAVLISVMFFMMAAVNRAQTMRFVYSGQGTKAEIEAINVAAVQRTLTIAYKYTDGQGVVRHSLDIDPFADDATKYKVGDKIDIVFLMNFPDQSRLETKQGLMMSRLRESPWMSIGAICVLGLLCIAIGLS
jgi:hypothetical protein